MSKTSLYNEFRNKNTGVGRTAVFKAAFGPMTRKKMNALQSSHYHVWKQRNDADRQLPLNFTCDPDGVREEQKHDTEGGGLLEETDSENSDDWVPSEDEQKHDTEGGGLLEETDSENSDDWVPSEDEQKHDTEGGGEYPSDTEGNVDFNSYKKGDVLVYTKSNEVVKIVTFSLDADGSAFYTIIRSNGTESGTTNEYLRPLTEEEQAIWDKAGDDSGSSSDESSSKQLSELQSGLEALDATGLDKWVICNNAFANGMHGEVFQTCHKKYSSTCCTTDSSEYAVKVQANTAATQQELELLKKVTDSPYVVNLVDNFVAGGKMYLVMDRIAMTFKQAQQKRIDNFDETALKADIFLRKQWGTAIYELSKSHGIVPLDTNMGNIMFKDDYSPVLFDFGNLNHGATSGVSTNTNQDFHKDLMRTLDNVCIPLPLKQKVLYDNEIHYTVDKDKLWVRRSQTDNKLLIEKRPLFKTFEVGDGVYYNSTTFLMQKYNFEKNNVLKARLMFKKAIDILIEVYGSSVLKRSLTVTNIDEDSIDIFKDAGMNVVPTMRTREAEMLQDINLVMQGVIDDIYKALSTLDATA